MDKHVQSIVEDLLPLYNEGLLSETTTEWLEKQIKGNEELEKIVKQSSTPLVKEEIESPVEHDKMIKAIKRKLSIYQLIFVGLSFYLAINTSILNESFGFILWYAVLGVVTFLFYKDMKIVFYISVLPIFIWSIGGSISDYVNGQIDHTQSFIKFLLQTTAGSFFLAMIHYLFALIGSVMGLLILKIKERG
ncbi:hypothetical protein [Fredinandcohnia sp. 179-A 10B2 NHS]|uniref:hypothetical protein n=1 Tax=Fredinandcohnia sp. 179-A 10B2 NHS TaxID=3235176 RepID=UPI0039A2A08C